MNSVHRRLKLHPHKHTGKVLPHRHTSYRALLIIMALAGTCMLLTNHMAKAADYVVRAKVSAPLPTGAPAITSPANGTTFHTPAITINGSCPTSNPAIMIVIYEGTTTLGAAQCSAIGTFTVPVTLHTGTQQLVATIVNITDDVGESSAPLTVTYTPLSPTAPVQPKSASASPRSTPRGDGQQELEIRSLSPFITYGPSKPAVWRGSFAGGQPPYTVNIAWGDGTTSWLKNIGTETQEVSHSYGELKPAYRVTITLRDSAGHELQMRLLAVTPAAVGGTTVAPQITTSLPFSRLLYLLYFMMLLILLTLWFIEHREAKIVAAVPVRSKRTRPAVSARRKRHA